MRIAILTGGGDAPGMKAAIRAVARTAFFRSWDVMGVWAGYRGLMEGRIYPLDRRRLGGAAVEALADGESKIMVGVRGERVERVPLEDVLGKERALDPGLYQLAEILAELPE